MNNTISPFTAAAQALHSFWSSFSVPAFLANSLPKGLNKPYILYTFSTFGMFAKASESATVFTYSESTKDLDAIISKILEALPSEGVLLTLPNGLGKIMLTRADPFCQIQPNPDNLVKARIISFTLTSYLNC